MATQKNASAGPSTFSGAQNVGVNEMNTVVAGGDVHRSTPVFNFNGGVHMANPSFGSIPGIPPSSGSRATLAPQRLGIVSGLSRLLTWLQAPAPQGTVPQETLSAAEVEDASTDHHMIISTPSTSQESISLSSLHDIETQSVDWQKLRTPEVYVFKMLNSMRGLPCWQPDPQGLTGPQGVIPGDVGTYSVGDGFMKLWNIWDDEEEVQKTVAKISNAGTYIAPQGRQTVRTQVFAEGNTVAEGPTATTIFRPWSDRIERFEFGCQGQPQGAVLALTAPAIRERLYNHTALRKHIIQHAETIYAHSNGLRDIEDDEALYIITGSVKSESWGLAAFSRPMNDSIMLEHLSRGRPTDSETESTFYAWTQKGTAEARLGSSEIKGAKDQALFLEGFKLDFSREFRERMTETNPSSWESDGQGSPRPSGSSSGPSFDRPSGPSGPEDDMPGTPPPASDRSGGAGGGSSEHGGRYDFHQTEGIKYRGLHIQEYPRSPRGTSCHPCDIINEALLEITGSPFALSHDDDWLSIAENHTSQSLPVVHIQQGVAFLGPAEGSSLIGSNIELSLELKDTLYPPLPGGSFNANETVQSRNHGTASSRLPKVQKVSRSKKVTFTKPKGAVRAKSGCYTCRIRRKKCDEERTDRDTCKTCDRLRLECLGFGVKRPEWLREKQNVDTLRDKIKTFLAKEGLIRGNSGPSPTDAEPRTLMLSAAGEALQAGYGNQYCSDSDSLSSSSLSLSDDDDDYHRFVTSSIRDQPAVAEAAWFGTGDMSNYGSISASMRSDSPYSNSSAYDHSLQSTNLYALPSTSPDLDDSSESMYY